MASEEAIQVLEKANRIRLIRWYNLSFKPAVDKAVERGKFSAYTAKKLLAPHAHLERQRIPTAISLQEVARIWNGR